MSDFQFFLPVVFLLFALLWMCDANTKTSNHKLASTKSGPLQLAEGEPQSVWIPSFLPNKTSAGWSSALDWSLMGTQSYYFIYINAKSPFCWSKAQ